MVFTAQQIAGFTGGTVEGNPDATISTFAKIEEGAEGALSFLANPQYEHYIYETKSSIVLVNQDFQPTQEVKATLVRVANAYESVAKLLQLYQSMQQKRVGIDSLAFIDPSAKIGKDCYIGPFVAIAEGVEIGDGTVIHPHATIGRNAKVGSNTVLNAGVKVYAECVIGSNCIIHAGAVIGADGFGFAPQDDNFIKIPQIGNVVIEDNVEIGANTCIDRATMGSTVIHQNVKLDNLIQIAHKVEIGEGSAFAAQVGIAGSAKVGKHCIMGGQSAVAGHIALGDKIMVGAKAGVTHSLQGGQIVLGQPAIPFNEEKRLIIYRKKLPELYKRVSELEKKLSEE